MTTTTKRKPTPEPVSDQLVGINVQLPVELHRRFRSRAVLDGLTLTEATVAAVEAWLVK